MPEVTELRLHPVKSLRGFAVARTELDALGPRHDRRFGVTDPDGRFLTQREEPRMTRVRTRVAGGELVLEAPDRPPFALPLAGRPGPRRPVAVWRHRGEAVDQGDAAAEWLSAALGRPVRLVGLPSDWDRPVNPERTPHRAGIGFADGYPLLLISEASLADLNARLPAPLAMERFRPNVVVAGCAPYAEDAWRRIRIAGVELAFAKRCDRCAIPTLDPETGERGVEPLRTLARYRRVPGNGVVFGVNLVHTGPGALAVGDAVEVLETA